MNILIKKFLTIVVGIIIGFSFSPKPVAAAEQRFFNSPEEAAAYVRQQLCAGYFATAVSFEKYRKRGKGIEYAVTDRLINWQAYRERKKIYPVEVDKADVDWLRTIARLVYKEGKSPSEVEMDCQLGEEYILHPGDKILIRRITHREKSAIKKFAQSKGIVIVIAAKK